MKPRSTITVDAVFDIETEHWDQFVCGGLRFADGDYREWDDENALVDALLGIEGSVWAHNGGRFDLLWFCQHVARRDLAATVSLAGSRIVKLEVGKTKFHDSMALIPLALKDTALIGGMTKLETGLVCSCGQDCGGYCRIRRKGMRRAERRLLSEYLRRDCDALAASMERLQEFAEVNDLDLKSTIGSSAWATIQRWLDIPDAEWPSGKLYQMVREGYYGGRVQVFQPLAEKGFRYDINSAYPAALVETALPVGRMQVLCAQDAFKAYSAGKQGIFRAACVVPESLRIPPLPVRSKERNAYPVGAMQGRWTGVEIREAQELGCKVEILDGVVWSHANNVLAPFCEKIWDLRAGLGKKHPIGKWLKWFANAPTGKLAQRPEGERIKFIASDSDAPKMCPADFDCAGRCGYRCCAHECTRRCGGWRPLDREHLVWRRNVWRIASSGYVHWAAYLTSATRITLGRQLRADDDGASAVYCDTDSCYATKKRTWNVGKELGQFVYEGPFERFQALAPKVYRYWDPDAGEWHVRAKGIPDAEKVWEKLAAGDSVQINRGVESFLQSDGSFRRRTFKRRLHENHGMYGDRQLKPDGRTYPCLASRFR